MKSVFELQNGSFGLGFDDSDFRETLKKVKALPDRRFNRTTKLWEVPNTSVIREQLEAAGFNIGAMRNGHRRKISIAGHDPRLYEFQRVGLKKIVEFEGRALLSMDMGLGKTATSLQFARIRPEERPVIIVVPAPVKLNWAREIRNWSEPGEKTIIMQGRKQQYVKGFTMIIINYDILDAHVEYLCKISPRLVIADEVQYVKNPASNRSKALKKLARATRYMIALSGTPIMNRPKEFWPILNMLKPTVWHNKSSFLFRYCGPQSNGWGMTFDGSSNTKELNRVLNEEVMFRVLKRDVLQQLPDKVYSVVPFDPDNISKYRAVEYGLTASLRSDDAGQADALKRLGQLRDTAVAGKMKQAIAWIRDFIDSGEKLVVFVIHHVVTDQLMAEFRDIAVKFDGRDSPKAKDLAKNAFIDNDKIRLIIGNVEAMGTGVDGLQNAASNVAFIELPWVPAQVDQAADRLHRIGQKGTVDVYYLIAAGTIEERMAEVIDSKRVVLATVLDGTEKPNEDMIGQLLKQFKES